MELFRFKKNRIVFHAENMFESEKNEELFFLIALFIDHIKKNVRNERKYIRFIRIT